MKGGSKFQVVHGIVWIVISLHQIQIAISRLSSDDCEQTAHIGMVYTCLTIMYDIIYIYTPAHCSHIIVVLYQNIRSQTEGQACQNRLQCQVELLGHQLELFGQGWQLLCSSLLRLGKECPGWNQKKKSAPVILCGRMEIGWTSPRCRMGPRHSYLPHRLRFQYHPYAFQMS